MFYENKSRIGSRRIGVSRFVLISRTGVWRYLPLDKHIIEKRLHAFLIFMLKELGGKFSKNS